MSHVFSIIYTALLFPSPSSVNSAPPQSISYLSAAVNPVLDLCQLLCLITCQRDCGGGGGGTNGERLCEKTRRFRGEIKTYPRVQMALGDADTHSEAGWLICDL